MDKTQTTSRVSADTKQLVQLLVSRLHLIDGVQRTEDEAYKIALASMPEDPDKLRKLLKALQEQQ